MKPHWLKWSRKAILAQHLKREAGFSGTFVSVALMLSLYVKLTVPTNTAISTLAEVICPVALQCPCATQDKATFFMQQM